MAEDKSIHIPREKYPERIYPAAPPAPRRPIEGDSEQDTVHFLDYWHVLLARRWTVLIALFAISGATFIGTFKQTPIFRASTTIQIDRENSDVLTFKDIVQVDSSADDTLKTQFSVLESRLLARRVIEALHLEDVEEFQSGVGSGVGSILTSIRQILGNSPKETVDPEEPDRIRDIIDSYLIRLSVEPVRQARLVRVSFDSKDPQLATRIVAAHARQYMDQNFEFKWNATLDASKFLEGQLVTLKSNLEKSDEKLQAYSRAKNILFTEEGHNTATEKLQQLQEQYTKAQASLFQIEGFNRLIEDGREDALPQLLNNQLIANLATKLADLKREEAELAVTFGPNYSERKRIRSQIEDIQKTVDDERDRIRRTIQAEFSASRTTEQSFAAALEAQRGVVNTLNQEIIQYNILKRESDSNKLLYDGLLTRLKEAGVSAGLKASNIRVVDPAELPRMPAKPRISLNLALGCLVGLMLGVGLAFFQEYLDNSVKSPEDVERFLRMPTLGSIPNSESLEKGGSSAYGYGHRRRKRLPAGESAAQVSLDLVAFEYPMSLMAEAYRSTRTSLLLTTPGQAPRVVLVTSAIPSEGKTTTAINTAISLTQTGSRVILIDGDMRKPRIHTVFGLGKAHGLSSFLTGAATQLAEVAYETNVPNLSVIPCGALPPNPTELILSDRFQEAIRLCRQEYDYVVLDSPPVANVSDARILGSIADATIVVVKAGATSRHLVQRAIEHMVKSHVRNISVILNDLDVQRRTNYYSYYSGRYYFPSDYGSTPPPK